MANWHVVFFPKAGDTDSPDDFIASLPNNEAAQIEHRLKVLEKLELVNWPSGWTKKIEGEIYQLTAGGNRLYYCLDGSDIVVLHACKKVRQKALRKDLNRAKIHYGDYLQSKKGKQ
jgi:phage-related protein